MKLLTEKDLVAKLGTSRTTIWEWRKDKERDFPKPLRLAGVKKNVWREEEIDAWVEKNLEAA